MPRAPTMGTFIVAVSPAATLTLTLPKLAAPVVIVPPPPSVRIQLLVLKLMVVTLMEVTTLMVVEGTLNIAMSFVVSSTQAVLLVPLFQLTLERSQLVFAGEASQV